MQILSGREPAQIIKSHLKQRISQNLNDHHYIVILRYGDSAASAKYVQMKQKFGLDVGIHTQLVGQGGILELSDILASIEQYNQDPNCVGIMCQLPLPESLAPHQVQILESINPQKDIDGLTGAANGKTMRGSHTLYPATVAAILGILDHYGYGQVSSKVITIINNSNLIGKPLAVALSNRMAQVTIINHTADPQWIISQCQQSDIIITATGQGNLITKDHTSPHQIIIDAGVDIIDGKTIGDVNRDSINGHILGCTPPTGGVGPMTVACLFDNIRILHSL